MVRRIRAAAARPGDRAAADPQGGPAPDGAAGAGEEALNEFHRRHYAAVLAHARDCCRSAQAAADLTKEAINSVLYSPGPGEGPDGAWRDTLLAAVRHTAAAWHRTSRNTELRDDFASWPSGRPEEGPGPSAAAPESSAAGEPTAPVPPVGTDPSAAPRSARGSRFSPARLALLAFAVSVLAGVAIAVGPLSGPERQDTSATGPGRSGLSSAPDEDGSPTASPKGSASASRSASGTPSTHPTKASKRPSSRPSSPAPSSPSASRGNKGNKGKPSPAHTTALVARPWSSNASSFAPARLNSSIDGHPLTIQGTGYSQGLGAHANTEIVYGLGGSCSALSVDVGLDDEVGANGSVVFQIYRDGTKVADSGLMTVDQPAKHLTADLTDGTQLRLVVTDGGNGNDSDHADWGNPVLTCR
ncbi:NPCBM/NEW2 domain-containing protein [Streptomyces nigrescens]|uniref:NPCBM/NEW2 domain-containing protein n=1 Tax=Streptomyces nigrescens TaxID=1920 RepID=UPI00347693CD